MSFTGLSERFGLKAIETESGPLGPGSYNFDTTGRGFGDLSRRAHSQKQKSPAAFGSSIPRQVGGGD